MGGGHLIREGQFSQVFAVVGLRLNHQVAGLKNKNLIRLFGKSIHNACTKIIYLGIDKADIVSGLAHDVAKPTFKILILSLDFEEANLVLKGE
jgi:hypothetical protein